MNRNVEEMYTQVAFILFFFFLMHVLWVFYQMQQNGFLYAGYASATRSWIALKINQMYTYQK